MITILLMSALIHRSSFQTLMMSPLTEQHTKQSSESPPHSPGSSLKLVNGSHDPKPHPSLAHCLPHELLAEIFIIGLDAMDSERQSHLLINTYLFRLTAVCNFWRFIAISMPTLWVKIRCIYNTPKKVGRVAAHLKLQLERSKDVLLDLELAPGPDSDNALTCRIVGIIYPHLHRCQGIALELYSVGDAKLLLPLPGPLKNLTALGIADRDRCLRKKSIITSADTPSLRILKYVGPLTALRTMQTKNLTHVLLEGGTLGSALDILSKCPAAQSAIIDARIKRSEVYPNPFTLGDLTSLVIPRAFALVFQHIFKAPKLDTLCLTPLDDYDCLPNNFHLMQPLPVQGLRKVTLEDLSLSHWLRELHDFMVWHPRIEHLTLLRCADPIIIPTILLRGDKKDRAYSTLLQDVELPEDCEPLLPSLMMLCLQGTGQGFLGNKSLGICVSDLLEERSTLSFAACEVSFHGSKVQLSEIEARFGHRFSKTQEPEEKPIWE